MILTCKQPLIVTFQWGAFTVSSVLTPFIDRELIYLIKDNDIPIGTNLYKFQLERLEGLGRIIGGLLNK